MGVEADDRINIVLKEDGHHHVPGLTIRNRLAAVDIQQFQIMGILHDIEPGVIRSFTRHNPRVTDAIPIKHLGTALGGGERLSAFASQMAADHTHGNIFAWHHIIGASHVR